ncbi:NAD(P)-dependent dehydrogenase (short-subunit alcohol dehydrogenase family) [Streptomyces violarus]|uniref:NAD(P)-dependent dehydrogenase (Short-subunit alcohol dehydrogenase family) n=1 Tax=Streptomyces violarus TaxID=67380 RepID=A0A7W5A0H6_9ACTN|nr:NAD(P)-dependent dehydrogenase (short-subunit alcohol dehydrogenase family) [Streptomyces violarus]
MERDAHPLQDDGHRRQCDSGLEAEELGPRGVTANLVLPGPVDTDMNPADGPFAAGQAAMTALGRFGTADEVAATVAHLAGAAPTWAPSSPWTAGTRRERQASVSRTRWR